MQQNKYIIIFDSNYKKKFLLKTNIKTNEEMVINMWKFNMKKISNTIKSYNINKKNEKINIIKKIEKFKKKYKNLSKTNFKNQKI